MTSELIESVKLHCQTLMEHSRCKMLPFHNWQHTKDVVKNATFIAEHEKISKNTVEAIIVASYFHDIGNIKCSEGHEQLSCDYADVFLASIGVSISRITTIQNIISATKMPQRPVTIAQKVICDADLAHLGKKNFMLKNTSLRKEWEQHCNTSFSDEQWRAMNVQFLKNHSFHTAFAKAHFAKQKVANIERLTSVECI
jgi:uncharacterized protein